MPAAPNGPALGRRIARIAIPAVGALAAEPLYQLGDTAIVGRLGSVPLNGLGVAYSVLTPLFWLSAFLEATTVTRIADRRGAGDAAGRAPILADALRMALVLGLVLVVAVEALARPICWLLFARGDVLDAAVTYLRIGALGLPMLMIALVGHGELQGSDRTSRSLVIVVIANVLNIGLELWFVNGLGWGLRGSAFGTLIAQVVVVAMLLPRLLAGARPSTASRERIVSTVRQGMRLTARTAMVAGTFVAATAAATRMGATKAAAHQIGHQLFTFAALALDALALAGQVLIAEQLGSSDRAGAEETARRLLRVTVGGGLIVGAAFAASARWLPRLFTHEVAVAHEAVPVLVLLGLVLVPGAVAFLFDGVYLGTADYGWLVRGTLFATVAYLPIWLAVVLRPNLGLPVLWIGLVIWMGLRAVMQLVHFRSGRWLPAQTRS